MATGSYIFGTLGTFSDGTGLDLHEFLERFDRCCLVANKLDVADAPVKGQLLMLHLEGRARAALGEFELSLNNVPQAYAPLKARLIECFDSASAREASQNLFDNSTKPLNKTEEEYLLHLHRLYKSANPEHTDAVTTLAVKRKFMNGINPTLRQKIFIFCNDPFAAAVTRENLLSHCRSARNLDSQQPDPSPTYSTDRVLVAANLDSNNNGGVNENQLVTALNNLSLRLDESDQRFDTIENAIASLNYGGQRGNFSNRGNRGNGRGGYRGGFRGGRRGYNNNNNNNNNNYNNSNNNNNRGGYRGNGNNRGGNNGNRGGGFRGGSRGGSRGGRGQFRCFTCDGLYHASRDCPFSGNC